MQYRQALALIEKFVSIGHTVEGALAAVNAATGINRLTLRIVWEHSRD